MDIDYLSRRKKEELNFIRQNAGVSIEAVVRHMAKADVDLGSRITVRNDLAELEAEKYIIVRKDKPRSQTHRLFINEENILVKVTSEMNEFKKKYFALLKTMKTNYQQIESKRKDFLHSRWQPIDDEYSNVRLAWFLYNHFIGVYLLRALFGWQDIKDTQTVNKLYIILFETILEIHLKLSELLSGLTNSQQKDRIFDHLLLQSFKLTPVHLEHLLEVCNILGLNKDIEPVVDCLWNISSGLVSKWLEICKYDKDFHELSRLSNPEDWKGSSNNSKKDQK